MGEIWIPFLLLFSALFSAGETSLFLMSSKKKTHNPRIEGILKRPFLLLNTILLGNNLVNILSSNIMEEFFSKKVLFFIPNQELQITAVILVNTFVVLLFGEVLPKNFALNYAPQVAAILVYPLILFKKIFYPLSFIFSKLAHFFIGLWGKENDSLLSKSEIKYIISLCQQKGVLRKEETDLIQKIIHFSHADIRSMMVPRKELLSISESEVLEQAWEVMKKTYSTKLLVYVKNIDNLIGFIHLKDLIFQKNYFSLPIRNHKNLLRDLHFISETKTPLEVLKVLRKRKVSFVVVLDEYGGTAGIITLNGILQSILGGFMDERDRKKKYIEMLSSHEIILKGNYFNLGDVKKLLKIEEEWESEDEKVVSFLIRFLEDIPSEGQLVFALGLCWEILEVKNNAITKIGIKKEAEI